MPYLRSEQAHRISFIFLSRKFWGKVMEIFSRVPNKARSLFNSEWLFDFVIEYAGPWGQSLLDLGLCLRDLCLGVYKCNTVDTFRLGSLIFSHAWGEFSLLLWPCLVAEKTEERKKGTPKFQILTVCLLRKLLKRGKWKSKHIKLFLEALFWRTRI